MWYQLNNTDDVSSPALLVYSERVEKNIQEMIRIVGDANRLRPHVKTHKMPEIVKLQMKYGINKFKCATIAEAEMVASCGAADILLAIQPVGPNIDRFFRLKKMFRGTKISCIADCEGIIRKLSDNASSVSLDTDIWLDINVGMNRTGIIPGEEALRLINLISGLPFIYFAGLHVYDGHIHEKDIQVREQLCKTSFSAVTKLAKELDKSGYSPVKIIAGGTPSFPVHAGNKDVECSPGTVLLWDGKSESLFSDMSFMNAAILITRIISKPSEGLLCLDLGHKAIASEMDQPRVKLLGIENYTIMNQNEEHMVIKTSEADKFNVGELFYGIPWHICPTVDRYDTVSVVNNNTVTNEWMVEARKRKISV